MRSSLPASLAVFALAATASTAAHAGISADGAPLKAPATLDCPAAQGALTRTAQAPDGKSCDYQGRDGETVRLRLAPVMGRTPTQALERTRAELHALVPVYREPAQGSDEEGSGDRADVDLPFLHVHAVGDRANVRLFGIRISSQGQNADVDVGHGRKRSVVHAGPRGAEVIAEEVGRSNASLVYVLAANHRAPSGLRAVGYVAKGPVTGPLVVAEFRSPRDRHEGRDGDHGDIGRLIDRNLRD
jgi:hypothetical protein